MGKYGKSQGEKLTETFLEKAQTLDLLKTLTKWIYYSQ